MNHSQAPEKSSDVIVVECDFEDPPEKVWRALTTPEVMSEWLMPNDGLRTDPGAKLTFHETDEARRGAKIECEVLVAQPPRLLQCRWREDPRTHVHEGCELQSIVTFELARTHTGGTHLRVVHGDFELISRETMALGAHAQRRGLQGTRSRSLRRMRRREPAARAVILAGLRVRRAA